MGCRHDEYHELSYMRLVDYCEDVLGFRVELRWDREDEVYFEERRVIIRANNRWEIRLYRLLHEAGHILISRGRNYHSYYPFSCLRNHDEARKLVEKVDTIGEEYASWNKGIDIARRLGIVIERDAYESDRARCLKAWMEWCLDK